MKTKVVPVAVLALLIIAVFSQTRTFEFLNFDDADYVAKNPMVLKGLTVAGLKWAFSGSHAANWHPLTWLSHMLDIDLFGNNPGLHHLVNVGFHFINSVLVMLLLQKLTGAFWRSAAVAALFAIHPLHVESVAWISERKDVLSAMFFLLSVSCYVTYARSRSATGYLLSLILFVLGLLSKPMVVTLPLVLLLLDFWPLARYAPGTDASPAHGARRLILEKLPFFLLSIAGSVTTYLAQSSGGGSSAMSPIALAPRIANSFLSVAGYLEKTFWPTSLASFYPHFATVRPDIPWLPVVLSFLLCAAVCYLSFRQRVKRPYLLFGWLWYLVMLIPVIGIIQVGGQAMADRYTYLPLVGIFVALVWGASEAFERFRVGRVLPAAVTAAVVILLAAVAWKQTSYWHDSISLHERSVAVTDNNWKALQGLCSANMDRGRYDEAVSQCSQAVSILPTFPEGWDSLGIALASKGEIAKAIPCFERALQLRPDYPNAYVNLGTSTAKLGDYKQSAAYFREALRIDPDNSRTWYYLGLSTYNAGDGAGLQDAYRNLQARDPDLAMKLRDKAHL